VAGWLPLHFCADHPGRDSDLARVLIEAGRQGEAHLRGGGAAEADARGRTPLDLACLAAEGRSSPLTDERHHRAEWDKLEVILRAAAHECYYRCSDADSGESSGTPRSSLMSSSTSSSLPPFASGQFLALHASVEILARRHPHVVHQALHAHPDQASQCDGFGRMPLHVFTSSPVAPVDSDIPCDNGSDQRGRARRRVVLSWLLEAYPTAAGRTDERGRLPLHLAISVGGWRWDREEGEEEQERGVERVASLERLIHAEPRALTTRDVGTGLLPFMLAAVWDGGCLDTAYRLLLEDPSVLLQFCEQAAEGDGEVEEKVVACAAAGCFCVVM